jgi:hypothetical protein
MNPGLIELSFVSKSLPAGGDPSGNPLAPGSPATWTGLGQASSISPDAAAIVGYVSPNQSRPADDAVEEDPEFSRLRGTVQADEEVGRLTASTTRKDYNTLARIALPIQDWVGEDYHYIQFWEEATDPIPVMEHPAADMYSWLVTRFRERAQSLRLPIDMPETFTDLSVRAYRDGKAGYILYEPLDGLAGNLTSMPVRVQIEYHYDYAKLWMGAGYTQRMLAQALWALTHNDWNLYPGISFAGCIDGTIRHNTTNDAPSFHSSLTIDLADEPQDSRRQWSRHINQLRRRPSPSPSVLGLGETGNCSWNSTVH